MRSKEVEGAIKILDKYKIRLLQTRKEIGLVEDFKNHHTEKQYNRCGKRANAIDTVLSYIEELENKLKIQTENYNSAHEDINWFCYNYISKQVIRDKIEVLRKKQLNEYNNYGYTEIYYHLTSMITPLKELLEGE